MLQDHLKLFFMFYGFCQRLLVYIVPYCGSAVAMSPVLLCSS